ncbi:MAG: exodeoxyribonuclease III [Bacilli bacterium]|nr:exodeoxyribonuclease III [Bacilli bacterium]
MKIISFNVNGIRAILKKDLDRDFTLLDPDIFIIEESKFSETSHEEFPFNRFGYETFWTVSKERKGYSGVAILTRIPPLSVHYGLENGEYDEEGRIITLEFEDFYLVGCYVPNSGDGLKRLDYRMVFEEKMLHYLKGLDEKKPVIYTGDLNVAHEEIDLKNPKSNTMNPGFTKEEREKFSILLENGFTDTFRQLYPDKVQYSWWSYRFNARENNAGWRIDYFVVSNRFMDRVIDSSIHNEIYGSDHCPVELIIKD